MFRRSAVLVALAFALAAGPARAANDVSGAHDVLPHVTAASSACGGTSPVKTSCAVTNTLSYASILVVVSAGYGYTGRIVAELETNTGYFTYDCNIRVYPLIADCTQTSQGYFVANQIYQLSGTASGVGMWQVAVYN